MKKLVVKLLGQELNIDTSTSDLTELEINSIVDYINSKCEDIAKKTGVADTYKLLLLAILNITDELLEMKQKEEKFNKKIREISSTIDEALQ